MAAGQAARFDGKTATERALDIRAPFPRSPFVRCWLPAYGVFTTTLPDICVP